MEANKNFQAVNESIKALYRDIYNIGELYCGYVVDLDDEKIIVKFENGGQGSIYLRDYDELPMFLFGSKVEVRIAAITDSNEILLTFPSKYRKQFGIKPRVCTGEVILSTHTAIAVFFSEKRRAGIRRTEHLKTRYQMLKPGQMVECFTLEFDGKILIYKIAAIIRDGLRIPTYDPNLVEKAVSEGSDKSLGSFLLGYVYEAIVRENGVFIVDSNQQISVEGDQHYDVGDLLEIRLSYIHPTYGSLIAIVVSVLCKNGEIMVESPTETIKVHRIDQKILIDAIASGSEESYMGYHLAEVYKGKIALSVKGEKAVTINGVNGFIKTNTDHLKIGCTVWVRVINIKPEREDTPLDVAVICAARN